MVGIVMREDTETIPFFNNLKIRMIVVFWAIGKKRETKERTSKVKFLSSRPIGILYRH
jgi:hypothetical protein